MNKKHWNTVEIEGGIPAVELRKMIDHSYELVVKFCRKRHELISGAYEHLAPVDSVGCTELAAIAQRSCNGSLC